MTPPDADGVPPRRRGRPPSGGREAIVAATLCLLRERGASRLTTREVAARAGTAEGTVFYHFGDRTGLLMAVINDGLRAFADVHFGQPDPGSDIGTLLDRFTSALEGFLDIAVVAMIAAQSDVELRDGMAQYFLARNVGPHRGVELLGGALRRAQSAGLVRTDIDAEALAMMVIGSCFLRVALQQMIGSDYSAKFPDRAELVRTVTTMLAPVGR